MAIASNFPAIRPSLDLNFAAGNFDPRITFSRASAATYYDGKTVAKAEENLLMYSQEFASWDAPGTGQCSVTSDVAVAPDGTMTADLLLPNTSTAGYRVRSSANIVATSAGSILSFYVKPAGYNFVSIVLTSNFSRSTIDVTSGAITNYGANALSVVSTTLVGDWYRVVLSVPTSITASALWLGPNSVQRDPLVAWAGDGTSGIYLWGAQLEQRSSVTAYTPTTTQPITNYTPVLQTALSGVPRIDHDPVTGECKGLLIEEQRTNIFTNSGSISFGSAAQFTINTNSVVAPDGTLTATEYVNKVTGSALSRNFSAPADTVTFSLFLKKGANYVSSGNKFGFYNNTTGLDIGYLLFNYLTGAVSNVSSSLTYTVKDCGNGWWRLSVTNTAGISSGNSCNAYFGYDGGASTVGTSTYLWGAQLEAGSFPTSYIKTEASQVTRAADSASMTGANFSSWYRQDEGTLFADASLYARRASGFENIIQISSGVNNNAISLGTQANASYVRGISNLYGSTACDISAGTVQKDKQFKSAFSYATNNFSISSSAVAPTTDTSGGLPVGLNSAFFGREAQFDSPFAGHIRRIAYYPKRLTDAQLQALTA